MLCIEFHVARTQQKRFGWPGLEDRAETRKFDWKWVTGRDSNLVLHSTSVQSSVL